MAEEQQQTPEASTEGASEQGGFSEGFAARAAPQDTKEEPSAQAGAEAPAAEEEPAAEAAGTAAPSQEAADASSGPKAEAFDPYAGLTPEQKAHFERLAASERSQRGRVGALSKKLHSLSGTQSPPRQTEERREAGDDGAKATDTGSTGEGKSEASDIAARLARLNAVAEEYGDINGPVVEEIKAIREELAGIKASATRHEVDKDAQAQAEAIAELEKAHPDFRDYNGENVKFVEWFNGQPAGVRALANSYDPKEVSLALQLFKAESGAASASTGASEGGNGGTATGDRRERQMDGLKQAPARGAPAAAGTPNDFGSAFKARATQPR